MNWRDTLTEAAEIILASLEGVGLVLSSVGVASLVFGIIVDGGPAWSSASLVAIGVSMIGAATAVRRSPTRLVSLLAPLIPFFATGFMTTLGLMRIVDGDCDPATLSTSGAALMLFFATACWQVRRRKSNGDL